MVLLGKRVWDVKVQAYDSIFLECHWRISGKSHFRPQANWHLTHFLIFDTLFDIWHTFWHLTHFFSTFSSGIYSWKSRYTFKKIDKREIWETEKENIYVYFCIKHFSHFHKSFCNSEYANTWLRLSILHNLCDRQTEFHSWRIQSNRHGIWRAG